MEMKELEEKGKQIEELKALIKKMKCCGRCEHYNHSTTKCKKDGLFHSYTSDCEKWQVEENFFYKR